MTERKTIKRNSSIELLRIIAVLMIIAVHYLGPGGGILSRPFSLSFNASVAKIAESLAIGGVNLFILITGYFSIDQKGINAKRLLGIIILVAFWGMLFFFHALAIGTPFSFIGLLQSLFPYLFGSMWYIRVYLILMLLSPFLNVLINALNEKSFKAYVIIILILFSLLPSFVKAFENTNGYDIIHFVLLYSIGAYIRNGTRALPSKAVCLIAYFFFAAITTLFSIFGNGIKYWGYDFISSVLSSVALFSFFVQIDFYSAFINTIAKTVLGIYILNISFPFLYTKFIIREAYFDSKLFIVHFLLSVVGFFLVACILELVRIALFSVTVDKLMNRSTYLSKRYLSDITNS